MERLVAALKGAGFVGVEVGVDGVIYARFDAALPEFSAARDGVTWRFAQVWPLRATGAQVAAWNALHPQTPMDLDTGETRMQMGGGAEMLPIWRAALAEMVPTCARWRRATRQRDEGM